MHPFSRLMAAEEAQRSGPLVEESMIPGSALSLEELSDARTLRQLIQEIARTSVFLSKSEGHKMS
jgi:hypothetical protein